MNKMDVGAPAKCQQGVGCPMKLIVSGEFKIIELLQLDKMKERMQKIFRFERLPETKGFLWT